MLYQSSHTTPARCHMLRVLRLHSLALSLLIVSSVVSIWTLQVQEAMLAAARAQATRLPFQTLFARTRRSMASAAAAGVTHGASEPVVLLDQAPAHVRHVTLNRPKQLNALNTEVCLSMHAALSKVRSCGIRETHTRTDASFLCVYLCSDLLRACAPSVMASTLTRQTPLASRSVSSPMPPGAVGGGSERLRRGGDRRRRESLLRRR